ncbi:MAG: hypothetical protein NTY57_06555 [Solirubrobacterales bacterium]|nr:hypothetical protein [Solirubrobacterales bacterium]
MTETRKIRTATETIICQFCQRGLLRGERSDVFHAHGESRLVCELCQPNALRSGWRRDLPAGGPQELPTTPERGGLLDRLRGRTSRPAVTPDPIGPREPLGVRAEPTGPSGRIRTAVEAFNASEHAKTIHSVGHSLGDATVSAVDLETAGVELVAAWDLCWYRWRVEMDHGGVSVFEAGRGYELAELAEEQRSGNLLLDADGNLRVP